jgi:hypothetical protein
MRLGIFRFFQKNNLMTTAFKRKLGRNTDFIAVRLRIAFWTQITSKIEINRLSSSLICL